MTTSFSRDYFPNTHWSAINNAGNSQSLLLAETALNELCGDYWFPLYAYARDRGTADADAKDLVQSFFFSHFLKKNFLQDLNSEKGRFRAYLLACFKNHSLNERKRAGRQKRGGGAEHVPIDWATADEKYQLIAAGAPGRAYDRAWAITLLERLREQLSREMEAEGKGELFKILEPGLTVDRDKFDYRAAANRLKLKEDATRKAAERLRRRYGELICEEILKTCDPAEVEQERRSLLKAFSD